MITYHYHPALDVVVFRVGQTFSFQAYQEAMERFFADSVYQPGMAALWDCRGLDTSGIEVDDVTAVARHNKVISRERGPSWHTAIVVDSDAAYGLSRMFEAFADEAPDTIRIFRELPDAENWLYEVRKNPMNFDLHRLLRDVFAPSAGETVLVMVDVPTSAHLDEPGWTDRRAMAREWQQGFQDLGAHALPLLQFPATGANNGDLPEWGEADGQAVRLADQLEQADIAVALTTFSATAPLAAAVQARPGELRVASMPGVLRCMESTALSADYTEVARKAGFLAERLDRAQSADLTFSTGHRLHFDLRFRHGHADDGQCTPDKPLPLINLPSGEAFIVPYEGERPGEPSETAGEIPVDIDGEQVVLLVEENTIRDVLSTGPGAGQLRQLFDVDEARRNIAELGLGCNDRAVISGNVLEDEKAGFHWAYGRSEHLGGIVDPARFSAPEHVLHVDIVYAPGCPITAQELILTYADGDRETLIEQGQMLTGK